VANLWVGVTRPVAAAKPAPSLSASGEGRDDVRNALMTKQHLTNAR
jgi:hypothetical protein